MREMPYLAPVESTFDNGKKYMMAVKCDRCHHYLTAKDNRGLGCKGGMASVAMVQMFRATLQLCSHWNYVTNQAESMVVGYKDDIHTVLGRCLGTPRV